MQFPLPPRNQQWKPSKFKIGIFSRSRPARGRLLGTIKGLLSFAVDRGMRPDNPAFKIEMFKTTAFRDWTDEELVQFEERWALGTTERMGFALAPYTAQRRTDLAAMEWSSIAGSAIPVRQSKTGPVMELPLHPELAKALKAVRPRRGKTILTGDRGKPLNPIYFGSLMAAPIRRETRKAPSTNGLKR
jgi:integrase